MTKSEFINRVLLIMNESGQLDVTGTSFSGADNTQIDKHIEGSYVDAWRRIAKVAPRMWLGNKSFKSNIGIIDTFTFNGGANEGFAVNDTIYITNNTGKRAIFKVLTVTETEPQTVSLVSCEEGFSASSYFATVLTGLGDITGDVVISVTAIKTITNDPIKSVAEGTGYIILPDDFYLLTKFKMEGWKVAAMEAAVSNSRVANIQSNEYTRGSQIRPVVVIDNVDTGAAIKSVLKYYSLPKGQTTHTVEEALYVPVVKEMSTLGIDDNLGISDQIIEPLAYLSAATVFTILEKYPVAQALEGRAEAMLPGLISIKGTTATVKQ
jgi:hypothetical protein